VLIFGGCTMDENKFFKFVWRFNGIIIMVALVATFGVVCYNIGKELFSNRAPQIIKNVAEDPLGQEKWRLGYPQQIEGTTYIYIPLVSELEYAKPQEISFNKGLHSYGGSGDVYSSPTKNILFINSVKNQMKWLFLANNQLITEVRLLSKSQDYGKRNIEAIMYQVVQKDTNGDKKLTVDDANVIAFSMPDGSRYKEVISGADRLIDVMLAENKSVFIMYQTQGVGYSATLRLSDMSTIGRSELPKVPN
jgi:hypothetical protein